MPSVADAPNDQPAGHNRRSGSTSSSSLAGSISSSSSMLGDARSYSSSSLNSQQLAALSSSCNSKASVRGEEHEAAERVGDKATNGGQEDRRGEDNSAVADDWRKPDSKEDNNDSDGVSKRDVKGDGGGNSGDAGSQSDESDVSSVRSGTRAVVFAYLPPARVGGNNISNRASKAHGVAAARAKPAAVGGGGQQQRRQQIPPVVTNRDVGDSESAARRPATAANNGPQRSHSTGRRGTARDTNSADVNDMAGSDEKNLSSSKADSQQRQQQQEKATMELLLAKYNRSGRGQAVSRAASARRAPRRNHGPYTFNDLEPYTDRRMIELQLRQDASRQQRFYPASRSTAVGLLDPWNDLTLQSPADKVRRPRRKQQQVQRRDRSQSAGRQRDGSGRRSMRTDGDDDKDEQQEQQSGGRGGRDGGAKHGRTMYDKTADFWRRPVSFVELPKIRAAVREVHADSLRRRRPVDYARAADECRCQQASNTVDRSSSRRALRDSARGEGRSR